MWRSPATRGSGAHRAAAARSSRSCASAGYPTWKASRGRFPVGRTGHRQPAFALRPDPRGGQLSRRQRDHHGDVGQHQMWVAQACGHGVNSRRLGTIGFGFLAAIGAAASRITVVCFSGDGSLKMNIQEILPPPGERSTSRSCCSTTSLSAWCISSRTCSTASASWRP